MSLATWKAEFYPVEAKDCPADEAVAHSLRKWIGLRVANRDKHDVSHPEHQWSICSTGRQVFDVNDASCALCRRFTCETCPLALARDGFPCDSKTAGESLSPFVEWRDHDDPEPMIAALEAAARLSPPPINPPTGGRS